MSRQTLDNELRCDHEESLSSTIRREGHYVYWVNRIFGFAHHFLYGSFFIVCITPSGMADYVVGPHYGRVTGSYLHGYFYPNCREPEHCPATRS